MSFDTRFKIISVEQALAAAEWHHTRGIPVNAFVTHMEVLRAGTIARIERLRGAAGGKIFVVLTDPEDPLYPVAARAEIAAGLRGVDYVVLAPEGPDAALAAIQPAITVDDEKEDRERTRQLIEHVRERSRLA